MKHQRTLYSKYACDDKLGIYSNPPMSNSQYRKMISNVKSKYMQDYYNTSKKMNKYCEEKNFNNLLTNYYQDFNILKTKYNFPEEEEQEEKKEFDFNEKEFLKKKENVDKIFAGEVVGDDFNFDVTDNLINELPKENNFSVLKNTQIKDDYDFRLQNYLKNKKYLIPNDQKITDEENENFNENDENNKYEDNVNLQAENNNEINISENNNLNNEINIIEEKESIGYLDDENQYKLKDNENYLILNQPSLKKDLPLFSDIISCNYTKNYRAPFYEHPETLSVDEEENKKSKEKKYEEKAYSDFDTDNNKKQDENNNNIISNNKNNNIINNDENVLILENKNIENIKLEDIIDCNFKGNYIIPEYVIPENIKKEMEEEKKQEENNKAIYNENIKANSDYNEFKESNNVNNINSSDNITLPMMNEFIKNDEEINNIKNDEPKEEENNNKIEDNNKIEKNNKIEENNKIEDNNKIEENNKIEPEKEGGEISEAEENNKQSEKKEENNIDEEDKFEKIDVGDLEDEDDDKKYDDFDG